MDHVGLQHAGVQRAGYVPLWLRGVRTQCQYCAALAARGEGPAPARPLCQPPTAASQSMITPCSPPLRRHTHAPCACRLASDGSDHVARPAASADLSKRRALGGSGPWLRRAPPCGRDWAAPAAPAPRPSTANAVSMSARPGADSLPLPESLVRPGLPSACPALRDAHRSGGLPVRPPAFRAGTLSSRRRARHLQCFTTMWRLRTH